MKRLMLIILFSIATSCVQMNACTIVAVSGSATADGRPLLLKNRDSNTWDVQIKIGFGSRYVYLCQCNVPDGVAYSGYNESGFSIINSHSYNMPNTDSNWNAYIMQIALERCATVDEFEYMLDSLTKPISVCSNYGVMDAQGHVAIFEVNAYNYVRFDTDNTEHGYIVRSNHSLSQDTTGMSQLHPTSQHRYIIATSFMEDIFDTYGCFSKEDLFVLTRCLVNSEGDDLRDIAPFDENSYTPVDFRFYVPRYKTTSMMVIEGLKAGEQPNSTVAWTTIGPPVATVMIPYLITSRHTLPQIAKLGVDGHSWLCYQGQMLKNSCFVNSTTLNLGKLYNLCGTGMMQRVMAIEETVIDRGKEMVESLRTGEASDNDVEQYYSWVDNYVEEQYAQIGNNSNESMGFESKSCDYDGRMKYYDIIGRRVIAVRPDAIVKKKRNIGIVIN